MVLIFIYCFSVRYCRLSRVRRLLGWSDSSLPYPPNFPAERIAVDSDYMAVYLVVNYVANGMVLCFIHAVVDIAQADNDEFHKTGWSNWCSTYGFDDEVNISFHTLFASLNGMLSNREHEHRTDVLSRKQWQIPRALALLSILLPGSFRSLEINRVALLCFPGLQMQHCSKRGIFLRLRIVWRNWFSTCELIILWEVQVTMMPERAARDGIKACRASIY